MAFTKIESRVLAYLDQHGVSHRSDVVTDLSGPDTRHGRGVRNGSNSAEPMIMGRWCKRLIDAGLVRVAHTVRGYYCGHEITDVGRAALRTQGEGQ